MFHGNNTGNLLIVSVNTYIHCVIYGVIAVIVTYTNTIQVTEWKRNDEYCNKSLKVLSHTKHFCSLFVLFLYSFCWPSFVCRCNFLLRWLEKAWSNTSTIALYRNSPGGHFLEKVRKQNRGRLPNFITISLMLSTQKTNTKRTIFN